jgi:hypothetical protein
MARKNPKRHFRTVQIDKIRLGPLRRESLNPTQLARLRAISDALDGIDGFTFEERERNFLRDVHPDKELQVWEGIASSYATFTASHELSQLAKKEAFKLLLMRSMSGTYEEAIAAVKLTLLTEEQARQLLRGYE